MVSNGKKFNACNHDFLPWRQIDMFEKIVDLVKVIIQLLLPSRNCRPPHSTHPHLPLSNSVRWPSTTHTTSASARVCRSRT